MDDDLVEWLKAQHDEDEWWAREASRSGHGSTLTGEHWHWECETTDQPVTLDPVLSEYVEGRDHSSVGLRSVEEYPSSVGPLSHLVIRDQSELKTTDAAHIALHDPARVLRDVEAKRQILGRCIQACADQGIYGEDGQAAVAEDILKLLALPYSDRPGYREEWRP